MNSIDPNHLESGALFGLLKALRCLQVELKAFRAASKGSIEEQHLWAQCEKRLQEIEIYKDMIPDDVSTLIMTHVLHSMEVTL